MPRISRQQNENGLSNIFSIGCERRPEHPPCRAQNRGQMPLDNRPECIRRSGRDELAKQHVVRLLGNRVCQGSHRTR